ncbi:hypothetical protein Tsubulata_042283 [Turnera subulata]|uniref:Exonuclease domain-containing protein n=1 Tax=Turnera subulata TaxID=218843 RepID=A0A9Q0GDI6_9ROSI|nr:hypothetical protein Tsubulata_042283 [Turnera subulata]
MLKIHIVSLLVFSFSDQRAYITRASIDLTQIVWIRMGWLSSILRAPRCRTNHFIRVHPTSTGGVCQNGFENILGTNGHQCPPPRVTWRIPILQSISTTTGHEASDTSSREADNHLRQEFADKTDNTKGSSSTGRLVLMSKFKSIQLSDAEHKIIGEEDSETPVDIFVLDLQTTGLCSKDNRIVEIAIRHLNGTKDSCFQSLVNPGEDVRKSSRTRGITNDMIYHPDVPRMEDLIPILVEYIESRKTTRGSTVLMVAHNGRRFDVPFLIQEFSRCKMEIPPHWQFLDTIGYAPRLRSIMGPKFKFTLQALAEYYKIPQEGPKHRAMPDVNLLTSVLEKIAFDLKLTTRKLVERSFMASDLKKKCNQKL